MSGRLQDKIVFLTGAAQGIGAAIARLFVSEGAKVALIDLQEELLHDLALELGQENALPLTLNVTQKESVQRGVSAVIEKWRQIDILINNAGITRDSMTAKMTEEKWSQVMDVNLTAPFLCAQAVLPTMREQQSGVILNASSISALGNIGQANYAASKAAVVALTKTWALEFARDKIRVNAVAPGFTLTPMVETIPEHIQTMMIEKTALKRMATPDEIAKAYCFLASDDASYITGQVLYVDGGLTCGA